MTQHPTFQTKAIQACSISVHAMIDFDLMRFHAIRFQYNQNSISFDYYESGRNFDSSRFRTRRPINIRFDSISAHPCDSISISISCGQGVFWSQPTLLPRSLTAAGSATAPAADGLVMLG
jgi:hypothetical protein